MQQEGASLNKPRVRRSRRHWNCSGKETNPRMRKVGCHSSCSGGTASFMRLRRRKSVPIAIRPSRRARGAPKQ